MKSTKQETPGIKQTPAKLASDAGKPLTPVDARMFQFIDKLKQDGRIRFDIDFARAIEISKQDFYSRKTGRNSFTIADITKTCELFGLNPSWVFGFENQMFRRFS